jgi:predicted ATPase/class 3 adenylate cyclase
VTDPGLPSGTVTLLFTDIEGSTRLLQRLGDEYAVVLAEHHRLVEAAAAAHGGSRVDAAGDGLFYSFSTARGGLAAAVGAQRELGAHDWPSGEDVRVRMGIHIGEPMSAETGYVGIDVHRAARICSAGHGGQILASEAVHTLIGAAVPADVTLADLGVHRLRGLDVPERLYQVRGPGLATEFPPVRSLDSIPNNLPRQLSSFIGREAEIAAATAQLRETSVLTLTGPGGVGKTRLALEIGAQLADDYDGGVWLVDLGSVVEASLVADAVASALGVAQHPSMPLVGAIAASIGGRRVLLIVDNCEHLLDAVVSLLEQLLGSCANLRVLATSREALGIGGESLVPVPSMSLPSESVAGHDLAALASCDAVRLFVDRARAAMPGFVLDGENASPIAQICRRLDGIPLAVELAAARVRTLPPSQIASRLDHRFRLLSGGSRTALPRHRTLRATFDWSFELLSDAERALLLRLSVFAGSFSLDAAEEVCAGGPVLAIDMIDILGRLVDRSMLVPDPSGSEARYRMLETIREYAQEHLAESGDAERMRLLHRDWFADLVERARPAFFSGPVQPEWLARLTLDTENLQAALRWADEDPRGADAELALASGLWRFWEVRGDFAEGSAWLGRALARVGGEVSARRATALTGAGILAARRGDYTQAASFHDASLMLYRELGDPVAVATACSNSASVAVERGDFDRARQLYAEAIELARGAGVLNGAAYSLINLADVAARQGEAQEADRLYAESIEMFRDIGDEWGVAHATAKLAQTARRRGDRATARERYREAIVMHLQTGDRHGTARLTASLGDLSAEDGDLADAEQLYQETLAIRGQLGDRIGVANVLERLAGVAEDRPLRAATLLGAAAAIREIVGARLSGPSAERVDGYIAELGRAADPTAVADAVAAGRAASWDAVLERGARRD